MQSGYRRETRSLERALVRNLFLRILGAIFLVAFLSLLAQVTVLFGRQGLLPAESYLRALRASHTFVEAPSIFWFTCSDRALRAAAIGGAVLSLGLLFNIAPRYCLLALWALYLSFVTIGQDFLSFQWDNLLLESAFFGLFITPSGLRPKHPPTPHPMAVFLMLWLVFRLHVESGAAKLLTGDPTWRDLTAMVTYYETAPLPTWMGWYAHQMPLWAHKLCALFTFGVELAVPLLIWSRRRVRAMAFLLMMAMQLSVVLTANYAFFNYLTMALCLFVLDDDHLRWLGQRIGWRPAPPAFRPPGAAPTLLLAAAAAVVVPISVVPFSPFIQPYAPQLPRLRRVLNSVRSINAYHLFASMTLVRKEIVLEGSNDGDVWQVYEFAYKPGNPLRAPSFVAPHQPRVDFQLWFLLLGGHPEAPYFGTLTRRLLESPAAVASLFVTDPFPDQAPTYLRVAVYRYRFTDLATRHLTGAWWTRELLGYSQTMTRETLRVGASHQR